MIPLDAASGTYANFLRVSHTPTEFILDFCTNDGESIISVSRVLVNVLNIKSFINVLQTNTSRYEERFGFALPETLAEYKENGLTKIAATKE
jgi:hypothetical protein